MSKKSKSTTNQTTHSVVTPTNPDWVTQPVMNLAGQIGGLSSLDPHSLVAGVNPLQTQAAQSAAALGLPAGYGQAGDIFRSAAANGAYTYQPTSAQATLGQAAVGGAASSQAALVHAASGQAATGQAVTGQSVLANSASLLDNLPAYMSPYLSSVVNSALGDYDFGAGQTRAQNKLALANDDVFGGSGGAIQTALSEDAINRGRAALSSQLLNQGFSTAATLSNQDADRRQAVALANAAAANQFGLANMGAQNDFGLANLSAENQSRLANLGAENQARFANQNAENQFLLANMSAENQSRLANQSAQNEFGIANMTAQNQFSLANQQAANDASRFNAQAYETQLQRQIAAATGLANVASQQGSDERANIASQAAIGDILRQIEQQGLQAPISLLGSQASLLGSLPLNLFSGSTTDGTMNGVTKTKESGFTLGELAQLGQAFAAIHPSDRRLKRDVRRLGSLPNGLGIYHFRYLWGPERHIGVMAQEVSRLRPEAIVKLPSGYLAVDYSLI